MIILTLMTSGWLHSGLKQSKYTKRDGRCCQWYCLTANYKSFDIIQKYVQSIPFPRTCVFLPSVLSLTLNRNKVSWSGSAWHVCCGGIITSWSKNKNVAILELRPFFFSFLFKLTARPSGVVHMTFVKRNQSLCMSCHTSCVGGSARLWRRRRDLLVPLIPSRGGEKDLFS